LFCEEKSSRVAKVLVSYPDGFASLDDLKRDVATLLDEPKPFRARSTPSNLAMEKLSENHHKEKHHIVAGTLLGVHLPVRRIISGSQLHSWVREQDEQPL